MFHGTNVQVPVQVCTGNVPTYTFTVSVHLFELVVMPQPRSRILRFQAIVGNTLVFVICKT